MKLLILSACLVVAWAAPRDQWQLFQSSFNKHYDLVEEQFRQTIFYEQVEFIIKHNKEADQGIHTYRVGINAFSDWTQQEYEEYLMGEQDDDNETPVPEESHEHPYPAAIDWRAKGKVTPMKNQGACGSCWAFAANGGLETGCALKSGKLPNLSEQQMVDCSRSYGNRGCQGGSHRRTYDYARDFGIVPTSYYKYTAKNEVCKFDSVKQHVICKNTGSKLARGEAGLATELAFSTVSVAIHASRPGFRSYKSGVYRDAGCSKTRLNHAVTAVGFASGHWIVKNSWGTGWGQKGYILMYRGENTCGIGSRAYRPLF